MMKGGSIRAEKRLDEFSEVRELCWLKKGTGGLYCSLGSY